MKKNCVKKTEQRFKLLIKKGNEKMAKKLIGVDLGGTTIKFAILTENGEIQQKWSIKTNIFCITNRSFMSSLNCV